MILKDKCSRLIAAKLFPAASMTGGKKVIAGVACEKVEDILFLKKMVEAGKQKPVIDRTYSLAQMTEAHTYLNGGTKMEM